MIYPDEQTTEKEKGRDVVACDYSAIAGFEKLENICVDVIDHRDQYV
jgi:hypothetical protein